MSVGWLLFRKSFSQNWRRLMLISSAVALGVAMLLSFTAMFNAIANASRYSLSYSYSNAIMNPSNSAYTQSRSGVSPLYILRVSDGADEWRDQRIIVFTVAKSTPDSLKLHGLDAPGEGEFYASPALDKIIKQNPDDNLAARYGKLQVGILPDELLPSPDTLMIVRGDNLEKLKELGAIGLTSLGTVKTEGAQKIIMYVMYLGIFIMLMPVILLVAVASQFGSVQREQRYAALRLVGATKQQITKIIGIESLAAGVIGVAAGAIIYLICRPAMFNFSLIDERYWPEDITVRLWQWALIMAATLATVLMANWWGMRRVRTSPLGVLRRQRVGKKPRIWRILPLLIGVGWLIYLRYSTIKDQADSSAILQVAGALIVIMIGLVLAGPWLTKHLAAMMAKIARRPAVLIGMKYISEHSSKVSRSVVGVVVALFAGSFYLTVVSGVASYQQVSVPDNTLLQLKPSTVVFSGFNLPEDFNSRLNSQKYISSYSKVKRHIRNYLIMDCQTLENYLKSLCPAETSFAAIHTYDYAGGVRCAYFDKSEEALLRQIDETYSEIDAPTTTDSYMISLPQERIDTLRSFLRTQGIKEIDLMIGAYAQKPRINPTIERLATLAYWGMAVTVVVATISLSVSTVGGLLERRRSLFALRLGGMRVGQLKNMVIIESLIPLVAACVLASGLGIFSGVIFMDMVSSTLDAEVSIGFVAVIIGSIAFAAFVIYLTLPIIDKITTISANRTE